MPVTHTVTCDYKCNTTVEVNVSELGLELPEEWDAFTVLPSLMRGTGLTFYRCPEHKRDLLPGEFLRYAMDELPDTEETDQEE